jgi:hypothetical protein
MLPDAKEAVGLVIHSGMIYGKVIDFVRKERSILLLDDSNHFRSLLLDRNSRLYRWGLQAQEDVLSTGSLVRVATVQEGEKVWRLDIGENFYKQSTFLGYNVNSGIVTVRNGEEYLVTKNTRYHINDYQVLPEDLRSGANVSLEYATVPPPVGRVLVNINARSPVAPPHLFISLLPTNNGLSVIGRSIGGDTVYLWQNGHHRIIVPNEEGRFICYPEPSKGNDYEFSLVALDQVTGSVSGRRSILSGGTDLSATVLRSSLAQIEQIMSRYVPKEDSGSDYAQVPITRLAAVASLAKALGWPEYNGWSMPYQDTGYIPAAYHPVLTEAYARGISRGYEDRTFRPNGNLTRGETAVLMTAVLQDLGMNVGQNNRRAYADAGEIPAWASDSIATCTAAGLLTGRPDGTFDPGGLITCGEMSILLERLLGTVSASAL